MGIIFAMPNLEPVPTADQAHYQALPSKIEGITVFGPAPKQQTPQTPKTYICPQCGHTLAYDVNTAGISCAFCGYSSAVNLQKVQARDARFEFTLDVMQQAQRGWGEQRATLDCDTCGAELSFPAGTMASTCPYCSSNKVNLVQAADDRLRPLVMAGFKLRPADLSGIAAQWLGRGWMHPKALGEMALLERFTPFYLPFWSFSAKVQGPWEAEVAHTVTETYYDSGSKSHRTRTRTEWRRESGQMQSGVSDLLVSGVDPKRIRWGVLREIEPFYLSELVHYQADLLAGMNAQAYDYPLPDAWQQAKGLIRAQAEEAAIAEASNRNVRNLQIQMDYADENWRYMLLPVYLASYRYEDKVYQVAVNGQTGTIGGQKPVDWNKVWLILAALFIPAGLLFLLGLLLMVTGAGIVFFPLALAALVITGIVAFKLYNEAVSEEAK